MKTNETETFPKESKNIGGRIEELIGNEKIKCKDDDFSPLEALEEIYHCLLYHGVKRLKSTYPELYLFFISTMDSPHYYKILSLLKSHIESIARIARITREESSLKVNEYNTSTLKKSVDTFNLLSKFIAENNRIPTKREDSNMFNFSYQIHNLRSPYKQLRLEVGDENFEDLRDAIINIRSRI